jgi:hypothetical protein
MPKNDNWDWPFLLYTATVVLHRPERQFWRMTPRKLNALAKVHVEVNEPSEEKQPKQQYIDQIM